jgi:hypothetical protein
MGFERRQWRLQFSLTLLCGLAGCPSNPPGPGNGSPDGAAAAGDGALPADAAEVPDLTPVNCAALATQVQASITAHAGCTQNTDCMVDVTACGLAGACGAFINRAGYDELTALVKTWQSGGCGVGAPCPSCPVVLDANCIAGQCGPAPPPNVGVPCTKDADCSSVGQYIGFCLDAPANPSFQSGYCALPCAHGYGCPALGLSCEEHPAGTGGGGGPWACFQSCQLDADCRTSDGYRCCPHWGLNGTGSVCFPAPCPQ